MRFDPENQPGIANLLTIMSSLSGEAIETIVERFAGKGYGEFKSAVADVVCAELERIQARYNEIINSTLIEETLAEGARQGAAAGQPQAGKGPAQNRP